MNFSKTLFLALASTALFACKTDEIKDDLGNVQMGNYSFHVEQEGAWAPGTSTNYAIKANDGTPKPDQVSCYYGAAAATTSLQGDTPPIVIAVYDPGDDDFDCTYVTPNPDPESGQLFIQVTYSGITSGGTVQVAK
jgi:hypothetical protein